MKKKENLRGHVMGILRDESLTLPPPQRSKSLKKVILSLKICVRPPPPEGLRLSLKMPTPYAHKKKIFAKKYLKKLRKKYREEIFKKIYPFFLIGKKFIKNTMVFS